MSLISNVTILLRGHIGKAVAIVVSGAVLGQAISVLVLPIVTRLFSPEAIGIQSVFVSVGNILATAAALTYPLALALPDEDADARRLIAISLMIGLITSLLLLVFVTVFYDQLLLSFGIGEFGWWLFFLPMYVFFSVLGVLASQYLIREKNFKAIAKTSWELSGILNSLKIIFGVLYPGALSLILINVSSGIIKLILSIRFLSKSIYSWGRSTEKKLDWPSIIGVAKKYQDFPIYRAPQAIIAAASQSLPLIIIALLFDSNFAGQFALSLTILSLPANFLGAAVSQVIYPITSDAVKAGKDVTNDIIQVTLLLFLIGMPVFGVIALGGGYLFSIIFGEKWVVAGQLSQYLAVMMLMDFLARPAVAVIPVIGRQRGLLFFEVLLFVVKALSLIIAFRVGLSPLIVVMTYSMSCGVMNLFLVFWAIRSSRLFGAKSK